MNTRTTRRTVLISSVSALLCGIAQPASAQQADWEERRRLRQLRRRAIRRFRQRGVGLPQRARAAIARGELRPLRELLAMARQYPQTEVLDVDLHETPQGWVYALRIINGQGQVRDLFFDARTLAQLQFGGKLPQEGVPLPPGVVPAQ